MQRTSKVALSALAAATLLAVDPAGQAVGQTRQVQTEVQRPKLQAQPQLQAEPQGKAPKTPGKMGTPKGPTPLVPQKQPGGGTSPGGPPGPKGPGGLGSKPPGKLPDFVLEPGLPAGFAEGLPNTGYCLRKLPATGGAANAVAFKIRFKTNGTQSPTNGWGPTKVTIAFQGGGTVTLGVPNASWDGVKPYQLAIPKGCYKPGTSSPCNFTISIDPADIVPESSSANNTVSTICTQPAG